MSYKKNGLKKQDAICCKKTDCNECIEHISLLHSDPTIYFNSHIDKNQHDTNASSNVQRNPRIMGTRDYANITPRALDVSRDNKSNTKTADARVMSASQDVRRNPRIMGTSNDANITPRALDVSRDNKSNTKTADARVMSASQDVRRNPRIMGTSNDANITPRALDGPRKPRIVDTSRDVIDGAKTTETRKVTDGADITRGADITHKKNEFDKEIFDKYKSLFEYFIGFRVTKELGIVPNRFWIDYNIGAPGIFTLHTLLYRSSSLDFDEETKKKLHSIFELRREKRKEKNIKEKKHDYNVDNLIDSNVPLWISLSKMNGTISWDTTEQKHIEIGIDRFDAFGLIPGGGHMMLCFLLKWVKKRFSKCQSISVKLWTEEQGPQKAYTAMGFKIIEPNNGYNNELIFSDEYMGGCDKKFDDKIGHYYYYYESIHNTFDTITYKYVPDIRERNIKSILKIGFVVDE